MITIHIPQPHAALLEEVVETYLATVARQVWVAEDQGDDNEAHALRAKQYLARDLLTHMEGALDEQQPPPSA